MPTERGIALIGAGGHSLVVIEALVAAGFDPRLLSLFDQAPEKAGTVRLGVRVGDLNTATLRGRAIHVCIGSNPARCAVAEALEAAGAVAQTVRHPAALVSPSATLGDGTFVAAGAIIGPSVEIGRLAIINHRAVVDHECSIGKGSHIAPGAVLGGAVAVGAGVLIGANATVLPGIRIGDRAIIGAGAVVVRDVPAESVQAGVPAREMTGG